MILPGQRFPTGLRPTSRARLAAATPFRAPQHLISALPPWFGIAPTGLTMYGNDTFGDCVTAEECASKVAYAVMCGQTLVIPDKTAIAWATKHGVLEGADLEPVIDQMMKSGITVGSTTYTDGAPLSVDYTNQAALCAAIAQGPIKIGIAAGQLQNAPNVGDSNGWVCTGFKNDQNEDHCTALWGYGTAGDLFANVFKLPLPASLPASTWGWQMYTWSTYGFIDTPSLLNICGEAWLRTPTTPQMAPVGPTPPIPPTPPTPVTLNVPIDSTWWSPGSNSGHVSPGYQALVDNIADMTVISPGLRTVAFPKGTVIVP